jgi:predicted Fe-Mo cluster-binding NifX family protein
VEPANVKIAIATDDGRTVRGHFGRSGYYAVLTVENGAVVAREMRPKSSPHGSGNDAIEAPEAGPHGVGPASGDRHDRMAAVIADCSVVICGGMGQGAYDRMRANGIKPILSDLRDVDQAAIECAAGRIVDHVEWLH